MLLPYVSLNAATAVGPGAARDLEAISNEHSMLVHVTSSLGAPSYQLNLEGSHDGTNWISMVNIQSTGGGSTPIDTMTSTSTSAGSAWVRYVRANLIQLSGGSSPTITATIASKIREG